MPTSYCTAYPLARDPACGREFGEPSSKSSRLRSVLVLATPLCVAGI